MFTEVIWDLETKKLFSEIPDNDPADLGVSIVSTYRRKIDNNYNEIEGKMTSYWEKDFPGLWKAFENADRVIGFNTLKFDIPVLQPHAPFRLSKLAHFDILQIVKDVLGKRISLDSLATETLDRQKSGIGVQAVYYWKQGDKESLNKLKEYCEDDVYITRDLYDYGLKNGILKYIDKWNTPREIEVDFSYPKETSQDKQTSLF
ncbi:ribonuclease H-like domain-containing protein [bacterium]|nr:ribonuclease H-like domain-containing protein [bacterium]